MALEGCNGFSCVYFVSEKYCIMFQITTCYEWVSLHDICVCVKRDDELLFIFRSLSLLPNLSLLNEIENMQMKPYTVQYTNSKSKPEMN